MGMTEMEEKYYNAVEKYSELANKYEALSMKYYDLTKELINYKSYTNWVKDYVAYNWIDEDIEKRKELGI